MRWFVWCASEANEQNREWMNNWWRMKDDTKRSNNKTIGDILTLTDTHFLTLQNCLTWHWQLMTAVNKTNNFIYFTVFIFVIFLCFVCAARRAAHGALNRFSKTLVIVNWMSTNKGIVLFFSINLNAISWEAWFKMQSVINTVKGTALGVAGYLTPVLKVYHYSLV